MQLRITCTTVERPGWVGTVLAVLRGVSVTLGSKKRVCRLHRCRSWSLLTVFERTLSAITWVKVCLSSVATYRVNNETDANRLEAVALTLKFCAVRLIASNRERT
jgi:hypothetical protein